MLETVGTLAPFRTHQPPSCARLVITATLRKSRETNKREACDLQRPKAPYSSPRRPWSNRIMACNKEVGARKELQQAQSKLQLS